MCGVLIRLPNLIRQPNTQFTGLRCRSSLCHRFPFLLVRELVAYSLLQSFSRFFSFQYLVSLLSTSVFPLLSFHSCVRLSFIAHCSSLLKCHSSVALVALSWKRQCIFSLKNCFVIIFKIVDPGVTSLTRASLYVLLLTCNLLTVFFSRHLNIGRILAMKIADTFFFL